MDTDNDIFTADGNYGEYSIEGKTAIIYSNQQWDLDINDLDIHPDEYEVIQAFPNPFNARVKIILNLERETSGKVEIYDMGGKLVRSLKLGLFDQGEHHLYWDSRSNNGISMSSGVYIVSFRSKLNSFNTKVLLVK